MKKQHQEKAQILPRTRPGATKRIPAKKKNDPKKKKRWLQARPKGFPKPREIGQ